jgi:hypothetical protein
MSKVKKVTFAPNKPWYRYLAHVPKSSRIKKLWTWHADGQTWASPIDYYIYENYEKLKTESGFTRPHVLNSLRTKWKLMPPKEKQPFIIKSRMKFKRDPEGIGYMAGEATLEEQKQFLMNVIQPSINTRKSKDYELCKKCNPGSHANFHATTEEYTHPEKKDFDQQIKFIHEKKRLVKHKFKTDPARLTKEGVAKHVEILRALNLEKKKYIVLRGCLAKAHKSSTHCAKMQYTCTLCGIDIWTSAWYVKSILHHQQNLDYFMMTKFNCVKILNGVKVEWCEREIVQVLNDIIAVATKL